MNREQALVERNEGGLVIASPGVGLFIAGLSVGAFVGPGSSIGRMEALGRSCTLRLGPKAPRGYVEEILAGHEAVDYGRGLFRLSERAPVAGEAQDAAPAGTTQGQLLVVSPQPGRVYLRPEPGAECFVAEGSELVRGQTLVLIEVMKMFTPVHYGGDDLPERARILRCLVDDESEVARGMPLFEIEPSEGSGESA